MLDGQPYCMSHQSDDEEGGRYAAPTDPTERGRPRRPSSKRMKFLGIGIGFLLSTSLGAAIGSAVDFFGPPTIQKVIESKPVSFSAASDSAREGWTVALSGPATMGAAQRTISGCPDLYDWAKRQGGADVPESQILLTAQGQRQRDIAITDMRAKIIRRYPIPTGTEVTCPTAGGGEVIGVGLDLDSPNPVAKRMNDSGGLEGPYFGSSYVTLAEYEIATFKVVAKAEKYAYEWELEVDVLENGKRGVVTIRDGDRPFRTAPRAATYSKNYTWDYFSSPPRLVSSPG